MEWCIYRSTIEQHEFEICRTTAHVEDVRCIRWFMSWNFSCDFSKAELGNTRRGFECTNGCGAERCGCCSKCVTPQRHRDAVGFDWRQFHRPQIEREVVEDFFALGNQDFDFVGSVIDVLR